MASWYSLIFFLLVGIAMSILWVNARTEHREPVFTSFTPGIRLTNLLVVFVMPSAAAVTYPLYLANDVALGPATGIVLWPIIAVSGIALPAAAVAILTRRRREAVRHLSEPSR